MQTPEPVIRISIVSHGQADLVHALLNDIEDLEQGNRIQLILTLNLPEALPFADQAFSFPLHIIRNTQPKGFGANHNAAFRCAESSQEFEYFCVLNPDIRLTQAVLSQLLRSLASQPGAALVAPRVVDTQGMTENSARRLPTPLSILEKAFHFASGRELASEKSCDNPDWVAGMFMLFRAPAFASVDGFDTRYHLYYEDVDMCCRLQLAGYSIVLDSSVSVVHDARRSSHRQLRYLSWHLASMARFFTSRVFIQCRRLLK